MAAIGLRVCASVVGVALLLAGAAGCRRPTGCPQGTSPIAGRASETAVWCQGAGGASKFWVELYPGTASARQVCPFSGATVEGAYEARHASGKPWLTGAYVNGRKHGQWRQTDDQGRKVGVAEYRDGQLVGGAPVGVAATCDSVTP